MLLLQKGIASKLNEKMTVVVYSLGSSAAFDMLSLDPYIEVLEDSMPNWVLRPSYSIRIQARSWTVSHMRLK